MIIVSSFVSSFSIESIADAPYLPNNPIPVNGSIDISVMTDLNWTGDDPDICDIVRYDIYFGETNPPPKVEDNQTKRTYNSNPPGKLSYEIKYFWQIVAWDNHNNSTTGPLWNFKTESQTNKPPNTLTNPSPPDCSTGFIVIANLSWVGGDPDNDPVKYDVYFGTTISPVKVSSNQSILSYNPGTLTSGIIYYWKIVAWDNQDANTTSPTWHFTTKSSDSGGGGRGPPAEPDNKKLLPMFLLGNCIKDLLMHRFSLMDQEVMNQMEPSRNGPGRLVIIPVELERQ